MAIWLLVDIVSISKVPGFRMQEGQDDLGTKMLCACRRRTEPE